MESGANQQLVAKNITPETENDFFGAVSMPELSKSDDEESEDKESNPGDPTKLDIEHGNEPEADETKEVQTEVTEKDSTLLDDLKAAEASLAGVATEVTEDDSNKPYRLGTTSKPEEKEEKEEEPEKVDETPSNSEVSEDDKKEEPSTDEKPTETEPETSNTPADAEEKPEKVIAAPANIQPETVTEGTNKYGQMLENELNGGMGIPNLQPEPEPETPPFGTTLDDTPAATPVPNPAAGVAPSVPSAPEINGVPEMNFMPMPGDEILPPPPAPPVDFSAPSPSPAFAPNVPSPVPPVEPNPTPDGMNLGNQPAMQDQIYGPQASTPDSFKIPGM
jgi:hypothetical protein